MARYRVYRSGEHTETIANLSDIWRDDLVTFALGCSFSFESAILRAGIDIRHISANRNVAMYATNLPTNPAGPFAGSMVVSMRAFRPADAIQAIILSDRYPLAHVHSQLVGRDGTIETALPTATVRNVAGHHGSTYPENWVPRFRNAYTSQMNAWVRSVRTGESSHGAGAWDGYVTRSLAEQIVAALGANATAQLTIEARPAFYAM